MKFCEEHGYEPIDWPEIVDSLIESEKEESLFKYKSILNKWYEAVTTTTRAPLAQFEGIPRMCRDNTLINGKPKDPILGQMAEHFRILWHGLLFDDANIEEYIRKKALLRMKELLKYMQIRYNKMKEQGFLE